MAIKICTGTTGQPYVHVQARLSQPATVTATGLDAPLVTDATGAADGTYSISLWSASDLTPTGTYYTITEYLGSTDNTFNVQVPATAGPFVLSAILVGTPTASPTPNHVSTLTVDALTNPGVVYADTAGLVATDSTFSFNKATKLLSATAATLTGALSAASAAITGLMHSGTLVVDGTSGVAVNASGDVAGRSFTASSTGPNSPAADVPVGGLAIGGGNPWFDPIAFGALGDGVTDSTTAFVNMEAKAAVIGGTCRISQGKSGAAFIVQPLTLHSNERWEFDAGVVVKLKAGSNGYILNAPATGNFTNVTVTGRAILDGNASNQTGNSGAIQFAPADAANGLIDGLTIRDVILKNCYQHGIRVAEQQGGSAGSKRIENCTLDNYGVTVIGYGVYVDYAPGAVIDGCTYRNSNGKDACVLGHAGKYRFTNNSILDSGVNFPFADDSTIAYNIIGVTVAGEGINNDSNTANRVRIIGNWVNAAPSAQYGGIRCVGADCTIADNYLTVTAANATTKGIMIQGVGARIHDNRIVGVAGAGSFSYAIDDEASANWIAHDNYISGPFAVGITLENDDIDVHDNKIDGPLIGVQLLNSGSSGHTNKRNNVHDNTFLNNATKAVDFQNQFDPTNKCHDNPGFNPVGNVGAAPAPSNGVVITNNSGVDIVVHFLNGTSACTLDMAGVAAAIVLPASAAYSFVVKHGGTYTPNFAAGAPSNKWVGL